MKKLWLILLAGVVMASCDKPTDNGGDPPPTDDVTITVTETSTKNVYTVSANLQASAELRWDFGNGITTTGNNVTAKYPFKGTYTITLTYKSPTTYETLTKTHSLNVAEDNPNLLEPLSPEAILLCGGPGANDSKTWVIDSLMYGHMKTGPESTYEPTDSDWNAKVLEKEGNGMYLQKMVFSTDYGFTLQNNGITFAGGKVSEPFMKERGAEFAEPPHATDIYMDRKYNYTPGTDWKWQFVTDGDKKYINFAQGTGFLIYFRPGPHKYEIIHLTEDELHVRQTAGDAKDNIALYLKFIREGVQRQQAQYEVRDTEDFEGATIGEFMSGFNGEQGVSFEVVDNPDQTGNPSAKVGKYTKGNDPWGAFNRTLPEGEFYDIKDYAKIEMKVYFPTTNDYDAIVENEGEWAPKTLQKKVNMRFRPGEDYAGDMNSETFTEEIGKWIDVVFDFSQGVDKTDFNKIMMQFGGEGHRGEGDFYFDDIKIYGLVE